MAQKAKYGGKLIGFCVVRSIAAVLISSSNPFTVYIGCLIFFGGI